MKKYYIRAFLFIFIILGIGFSGLYVGQIFFSDIYKTSPAESLHNYLHSQLKITPEQEEALSIIEEKYHKERNHLDKRIRLANIELADAIKNDPSYSLEVENAVEEIHLSMGELQSATLKHLFEMQTILNPEQNKKFNHLIVDTLYQNAEKKDK